MINKDSIVTAYDEHLTLVEWLQKVETALNSAVLTNLGIAKLSDKDNVATYQVTATFADNTTIASDSFTLPSTDIVTAFNSLATLVKGFDSRITKNTNNVNSILDIIDIANDKIKADVLNNSINGDDNIIVTVDNDENNEKLGIHLSPELQEKLARVLLLPSSAPSNRKVVTIATNGSQENVDGTELTTLMPNIVDSHGNKRFVEGNGAVVTALEGLTITSNKWSLSGSHIMFVVAGTFANGTELAVNTDLVAFTLPTWIYNKIVPTWGVTIENKTISAYANDWSFQSPTMALRKIDNKIFIRSTSAVTFTAERSFRIQFDYLVDSD